MTPSRSTPPGSYAELLRRRRAEAWLTQEQLAEKTGLSVRTIQSMESGRVVRPHRESVRLLASALNLSGSERDEFLAAADAGFAGDARTGARAGTGGLSLPTPGVAEPVAGAAAGTSQPAQLPMDVRPFTGRHDELRLLGDVALPGHTPPDAPVVVAVVGTAGVGKTALAVHWAHGARRLFPDGQLFADLRGHGPDRPAEPANVLTGFLRALGVAAPAVPSDGGERAAMFRTLVAGRRMSILLDNASSAEQVRPLLPGVGPSMVLVTSRDSLTGLVAREGVHRIELDLLPATDAIALLRHLVGARVGAEPEAAATLADRCVRLPLALRVAAELAVRRPTTPLRELVAELADQRRRLDLLDLDGDATAVSAVFSWSVRCLPAEAARLFRLLGLHPGPDFDTYAAAALLNFDLETTRRLLDRLTRDHLVHAARDDRYAMHDLLRAYAAAQAAEQDTDDERRAALERLFDLYGGAAAAAMDQLYPAETHRRPRVPAPVTPTSDLADSDTARDWLDRERVNLTAVARYTAANGWPTHTVRLSNTLYRYLASGHHADALTIHSHAHDAARRAQDQVGQAYALVGLGGVEWQLSRHERAAEYLSQALRLFRQIGDHTGEARALVNLGAVETWLGGYRAAAEHCRQALAIYRLAGDLPGEARALTNLGEVQGRLGHSGQAVASHIQALAVFRRAGDQDGEAHALTSLGEAECRLRRYGRAIAHLDQALALHRQFGNRSGEAWTLTRIGTVHACQGRPTQAAEQHRQALSVFREMGDRDGEPWALNGLAEAASAAGRPVDALAYHTEALALADRIGVPDQKVRAHAGLGYVYRVLGDAVRAREHYERALAGYTDRRVPEARRLRDRLASMDRPVRR